jgi:hypothetical protein
MRRVNVVVMDDELRIRATGFADGAPERLALKQVEVQSGGEYENFP